MCPSRSRSKLRRRLRCVNYLLCIRFHSHFLLAFRRRSDAAVVEFQIGFCETPFLLWLWQDAQCEFMWFFISAALACDRNKRKVTDTNLHFFTEILTAQFFCDSFGDVSRTIWVQ